MTVIGGLMKDINNAHEKLKTDHFIRKEDSEKFAIGDIVQHFKRETVHNGTNQYLYKIIAFSENTETGDEEVVYQALYDTYKVYSRPADMFFEEVDIIKYPDIKQKFRFEKVGR